MSLSLHDDDFLPSEVVTDSMSDHNIDSFADGIDDDIDDVSHTVVSS